MLDPMMLATLAFTMFVFPAQQVDPAICTLPHGQPAAHGSGGMDHSAHAVHAAMDARGTRAMGFDQSRASHHFRLTPRGGSIEIHINRQGDEEVRQQIASHLKDIEGKFKGGDFSIPFATHAEAPDGVDGLRRFRHTITYTFEPMRFGGRLVISSETPEALEAIHQFLRYQIREHKTGDMLDVLRN